MCCHPAHDAFSIKSWIRWVQGGELYDQITRKGGYSEDEARAVMNKVGPDKAMALVNYCWMCRWLTGSTRCTAAG